MKKIFLIIILWILVSCNNQWNQEKITENKTENKIEEKIAEEKINEKIEEKNEENKENEEKIAEKENIEFVEKNEVYDQEWNKIENFSLKKDEVDELFNK